MRLRTRYFNAVRSWFSDEPGDRLLLIAFSVFVLALCGCVALLLVNRNGVGFEQAYYIGSLAFFFYVVVFARRTFNLERQKTQIVNSYNIVSSITARLSSSVIQRRIKNDLAGVLAGTLEHDKGNRKYFLYDHIRHLSWEYQIELRETVFYQFAEADVETQEHVEEFLQEIKGQYDVLINHIYRNVLDKGDSDEVIQQRLQGFKSMVSLPVHFYGDEGDIVPETELVHVEQKKMGENSSIKDFDTYLGTVMTDISKAEEGQGSWHYFDRAISVLVSRINGVIRKSRR